MSDNIEKIKAKIAKLLALATDGGASENEAETALRHAEALMRKHAIDAATIHQSSKKETFKWLKAWVTPYKTGTASVIPKWMGVVAYGVGVLTDTTCVAVMRESKGACLEVRGEETDVIYATYLINFLKETIHRVAGQYRGSRRDRSDFRFGMAARLQQRMKNLKAEQREALNEAQVGSGTALMVVDHKLAERDRIFGKIKTKKEMRRTSEDAYEAGKRAGDRVGLGRPVEGGAGAKRLGMSS